MPDGASLGGKLAVDQVDRHGDVDVVGVLAADLIHPTSVAFAPA